MPQGSYEAVRVVIGEGEGQNWWCVLFPPLCIISSTDEGLSLGSRKEAQVSFKCLELLPREHVSVFITLRKIPKMTLSPNLLFDILSPLAGTGLSRSIFVVMAIIVTAKGGNLMATQVILDAPAKLNLTLT